MLRAKESLYKNIRRGLSQSSVEGLNFSKRANDKPLLANGKNVKTFLKRDWSGTLCIMT
jgi:hypothetical protein